MIRFFLAALACLLLSGSLVEAAEQERGLLRHRSKAFQVLREHRETRVERRHERRSHRNVAPLRKPTTEIPKVPVEEPAKVPVVFLGDRCDCSS
jgi:hypothetical protein